MLLSTKHYATALCSIVLFGSQAAAQINPNIAWGVTGNNEVWHLSSSGWAYVPPPANATPKVVSAAADGTVWSLDSSDNIYSYNGSGWQLMPGLLHQVSVGNARNAWGVTSGATIWRWNGSTWAQVAGPSSSTPKHVSVAMDGTVWCLDTVGNMFSYTGSGWQQVSGSMMLISVSSASSVWGINSASGVYHWDGSTWTFAPLGNGITAKWVGASADGTAYALDVNCNVWAWHGSWQQISGILVQISGGLADRYSNSASAVSKQGAWISQANSSTAAGSYLQSSTANDTITFKFTGDSVALYRIMDSNGGRANVTVDGKDQGTWEFYFPQQRLQVPAVIDNLGAGTHTLVLTVSAFKNSASAGKNVYVDSFTAPAPFTPTAVQLKALSLLNSYRAGLGYPPARLSATLSLSGQAHADYMAARGFAGLAHAETAGTADYTGASPSTRVTYFGYSVYMGAGETIDNDPTPDGCLSYWTSVIYHRESVFNYFNTEVGFGSNSTASTGMCAMEYASRGSSYPANRYIASYPSNNQTNVPVNYSVDAPDPYLADPSTLGPAISLYLTQPITADGSAVNVPTTYTLTDDKGNTIPMFLLTQATDPFGYISLDELVLIPKQVLKPNTQYKVLVAGNDSTGAPYSSLSSFTTVPNSTINIINGTWLSNADTSFQFSTAGPVVSTQVVYGATTSYGLYGDTIADLTTPNLFAAHLRNLASGTYHCQVIATDAQGNVSRSPDKVIVIQ